MSLQERTKYGINEREELFCKAYILDKNHDTQKAYEKAGYKKGSTGGAMLLKKPEIQKYIDDKLKKVEKKFDVSLERIIQEYAKIAFSNIDDYLSIEEIDVVTKDKYGQTYQENMQAVVIKNTADIGHDKLAAVAEVKTGKDGSISYKLYDKPTALTKLGEFLGMFKQEVSLTAQVNNVIEIKLPPELQDNKSKEIVSEDAEYEVIEDGEKE